MNNSTPSLIFELIKTLQPTEKAYVKKQFSANEKNLKQLFDDLNKTDVYEKNEFRKKYEKRAYLKHLSQNKTYLRKKIIEALIQYNSKSIPQINQRYQLNTINVLIHKGLLKQAVKLIEIGLNENEKLESYIQCYELCSLITNLSRNYVSLLLSVDTLSFFKKKRRFYIKQLSKIEKFSELADIHYLDDHSKTEALEQKLKNLGLENVDDLEEEYPFYCKRIFYFTKLKLAELRNNWRLSLHFSKKNLNLYLNYPQFLEKNYSPFISDSLNFLNVLVLNGLYSQFFEEYKKIIDRTKDKIKIKDDFTTSYYVIKYCFFQIACNKSKKYQKAFTFSNKYLKFIATQKNLSVQFLAASRICIAVANLNLQQFDEAIAIINPIQNTKFYQYQYELRLIQIIAHYRLGNDLVLDSLFTSFIYYLKKQEKPEQTKAIRTLKKCLEKQDLEALQNVEFDELLSLNVQFALTTTLVPE